MRELLEPFEDELEIFLSCKIKHFNCFDYEKSYSRKYGVPVAVSSQLMLSELVFEYENPTPIGESTYNMFDSVSCNSNQDQSLLSNNEKIF